MSEGRGDNTKTMKAEKHNFDSPKGGGVKTENTN